MWFLEREVSVDYYNIYRCISAYTYIRTLTYYSISTRACPHSDDAYMKDLLRSFFPSDFLFYHGTDWQCPEALGLGEQIIHNNEKTVSHYKK